jgi:hypothetical protein
MIKLGECQMRLSRVTALKDADETLVKSEMSVYKSDIIRMTDNIIVLEGKLDRQIDENHILKDEAKMYKDRMIAVEDAIKNERGISIRNEVIKIDLPFNKLDFVILYSGVCKLLKDSGVLADSEAYIKILKSLQEIIDKLPEPIEEKDGKPTV